MKKGTLISLLLLTVFNIGLSQTIDSTSTVNDPSPPLATNQVKAKKPINLNPTVGLGVGMLSYFGDVKLNQLQAVTAGNIAYELSITQDISSNFLINLNLLYGKLGANETQTKNNRNINFESTIRAGGVSVMYNFGHILPKTRRASPFISLGFEAFEFQTKTDAFDKGGNEYFYWDDGSIRNINQDAANANQAIELTRDYTFESDIREMNVDGFGKYKVVSLAIPIGLGATFAINDFINFRIASAMHFTFTDYIDGITFKSKGNRQGDNKYDNFLMSSAALTFNLGRKQKENRDDERYRDIDFETLNTADADRDGVPDFKDACQSTPLYVAVDSLGCPLDDDGDGCPNYKDDELMSPPNSIVNAKGVQLTSEQIENLYGRYIDSTMAYVPTITRVHKGSGKYNYNRVISIPETKKAKTSVNTSPKKAVERAKVSTPPTPTVKKVKAIDTNKEKTAKTAKSIVPKTTEPRKNTYTIQNGDNLSKIALKNQCTVADIKKWNNMSDDKIFVGKQLIIYSKRHIANQVETDKTQPTRTNKAQAQDNVTKETVYTIRRGDNLSTIAQRNNCSVADIKKWNNIKEEDKIFEGKKIIIKTSTNNSIKPNASSNK